MSHWHVANGLAGYGPDGTDGFATAQSMPDVADLVRAELRSWADAAIEDAYARAEHDAYRDAWQGFLRCEDLGNRAANFDNARADAPLYAGRPEVWAETIRTMLDDFPLDVSDNSRLYVWECAESDCDAYAEYVSG